MCAIGDGAKLGLQSFVGFGSETTYGTAATCSTFTEFNSESMKKTIEEVLLPAITTQRTYQKRFLSNVAIEGTVEFPFSPIDGIMLLRHALGGTVTSAGAAATGYIHTFTPGTDLPTGLTVKVRRGADNYCEYKGCKVANITIRGTIGEAITASYTFNGQDAASATTATPTFTDKLPFIFTGVQYQEAASVGALTTTVEQRIRSFELTIANNLEVDPMRSLGTNTVMNLYPQMRDITLNLEQRFDTTTSYDKFVAGTPAATKIILTHPNTCGSGGGATTYACHITMPKCYYNGDSPEVGGPGVLMHTLPLRAIADSLTGYDVQFIVNNDVASY